MRRNVCGWRFGLTGQPTQPFQCKAVPRLMGRRNVAAAVKRVCTKELTVLNVSVLRSISEGVSCQCRDSGLDSRAYFLIIANHLCSRSPSYLLSPILFHSYSTNCHRCCQMRNAISLSSRLLSATRGPSESMGHPRMGNRKYAPSAGCSLVR